MVTKKRLIYFSILLLTALMFVSVDGTMAQDRKQDDYYAVTDSTFTHEPAGGFTSLTTGRRGALIAGILGLISLLLSWRSGTIPASGTNRLIKIIALIAGVVAVILSLIHLNTSAANEFGAGSGKAGAIAALVLGLAGITLSGQAIAKKRQ